MITGKERLIARIATVTEPEIIESAGHLTLMANGRRGWPVGDLCNIALLYEQGYGKCKVCKELRPIAEEAIAINRLEASVQ